MTYAEKRLWERLRAHRLDGWKFRRQHAMGRFIVDFVCLQSRLVIEVDGDTHDDARQRLDAQRSAYFEKMGFRVHRFRNDEVVTEPDFVVAAIREALDGVPPGYRPSPVRGYPG